MLNTGLYEVLNGVIDELRGNKNVIDQETLASFQELTEVKEQLRKRLKNRTKKYAFVVLIYNALFY